MDQNAKEESTRDQATRLSTQFKSSWVNIGEFLTKIASEKLYEEWGYKKFEDYCKTELKLKKATAMKLTNAYFFLSTENPELLKKGLDLDVVAVLQKAKKSDKCDGETYNELIDLAVLKDRSASTISQKLNSAEVNPGDKMSDFQRKNGDMASRLLGRIKPIDDIPEEHKENLSGMLDYFKAESKVDA